MRSWQNLGLSRLTLFYLFWQSAFLARFSGRKEAVQSLLPQKAFKYNNKNGQGN